MTRATIPDSVYFRNWKKSTDALRSYLQRKLDTVHDRAAAKRKEADEIELEAPTLEASIRLLDDLLPAKRAALPQPVVEGGDRLGASGRWSTTHDACTKCGTRERKHAARGLCTQCYWAETHPETPVGQRMAEAKSA